MSRRRATNRTPGVSVSPRPTPKALQIYPSGAWDGARNDLRELRDWNPGQGSALSDNVGDIPELRNRSRDLMRNAPLAAGARQTVRMGVIGTGLRIYPRAMRKLLLRLRPELTEAALDDFETFASDLWWAWSDSTGCDIQRTRRFRAMTAQAFQSAWSDGDMLVIRRHVYRPGDVLSLKLQFVEADRLSTPPELRHRPDVVDGVEMDADGAPIAYHIEDVHPGERFVRPSVRKWTRQPAFGPDGSRRVLHVRNLSSEDRIGAIRGLPSLAPVIVLLKQISRYGNAELMRNVVASLFTAFIETTSDAPSGTTGIAPLDPNSPPDNAWEVKLDTGAVVELPPGKKISLANPTGPQGAFDPFTTSLLRQLGAAINVPFELLVRHFSSSYSASRAAINFAYEAFDVMRAWMEDDFVAPIYEWFLFEAVGLGLLQAPGFMEDPIVRRAYSNFRLQGPVAPQIDPLKEALAAGERMDILVSTHQAETERTTGGDWDDNVAQMRRERQQIKDAGLDVEQTAERIRTEPIKPTLPDGSSAEDEEVPPEPPKDEKAAADARRARRRKMLQALLNEDIPAMAEA
jgi:lambda family phage portal protein